MFLYPPMDTELADSEIHLGGDPQKTSRNKLEGASGIHQSSMITLGLEPVLGPDPWI